jgi:hypothetical protein
MSFIFYVVGSFGKKPGVGAGKIKTILADADHGKTFRKIFER